MQAQAYVRVQRPVRCCCCSGRLGLRVLGIWWLIECIISLIYVFLPLGFIVTLITFLSLSPPFLAFCKMRGSVGDTPETRLALHESYKFWAIIIGLPLLVIFTIVSALVAKFERFKICVDYYYYNQYCYYGDITIITILQFVWIAANGFFRWYFLTVMKKYHEEGLRQNAQNLSQYEYQPVMISYQQPAPNYQQPAPNYQQPAPN